MRKAIMALLMATTACTVNEAGPQTSPVAHAAGHDLTAAQARFARIEMAPDASFLNAEERQVVNLLMQAAALMDPIYLRQVATANPRIREEIAATNRPDRRQLLDMFDLHFGPWDTLEENRPFWGDWRHGEGAGFYPADLTRAELDAYVAAHPAEREALMSGYTVVRRQGGRLVATPYSEEYREWLEPAARLLEQAAAITSNASLRRFLTLRAQAFRTNDYFESEMAWMDIDGTPIEPVIGPYEVYTDGLTGQKTAFEAFITVRDPGQSAALQRYKALLRDMESNLPVEERYKNFNRQFDSPILVADQLHGGGDNRRGVQTIAFNLPNDERVREAKGAKKVILANVLGAKYERILRPMAPLILVPEQAGLVNREYMTQGTLFHELSHSLGPGTITVGGRQTTVNAELRDIYSRSEEAKADVMGVYNILYLMRRGELPAAERPQALATYLAGLFRAMRFGTEEAHGQGAALQYNYFRERGAFEWDANARRFRINNDRLEEGINALTAELVRLQGDGNYAGMQALFQLYSGLDDNARAVIASMAHIPTDIHPIYPDRI